MLFLGYDDMSSFDTALLYNPESRRIRRLHTQDVYFSELKTYSDYLAGRVSDIPPPVSSSMFTKHSSFLYETSSGSDDSSDDGRDSSSRPVRPLPKSRHCSEYIDIDVFSFAFVLSPEIKTYLI